MKTYGDDTDGCIVWYGNCATKVKQFTEWETGTVERSAVYSSERSALKAPVAAEDRAGGELQLRLRALTPSV